MSCRSTHQNCTFANLNVETKFQEKSESGKAASLSIANVGGIFVVLLAGLGIACVTAGVEYVLNNRQDRKARKVNRNKKHFHGSSTRKLQLKAQAQLSYNIRGTACTPRGKIPRDVIWIETLIKLKSCLLCFAFFYQINHMLFRSNSRLLIFSSRSSYCGGPKTILLLMI